MGRSERTLRDERYVLAQLASYGMYLMHMFLLPAIFVLLNPLLPVPLTIICTALLTYFISFAISFLIGKLPFGKYIVG